MSFIKEISNFLFKSKTVEVPPYPSFILMEVTNACNLRCSMCLIYGEGVTRSRETGFIRKDIWQGAIDEMGSWPGPVTLDLHGAGEPLLHPGLFDIISHAKTKGNLWVGFLSNATLLSREKAAAVMETGVDWVGFSVDGAQKEVFESYRKGAILEEVEDNINHLLSLRTANRPAVFLNMVCHAEADRNLFIERWKGKVDHLQLSIKRPNDRKKNTPVSLLKPCALLSEQLIMGWDGHTALCCEDFFGDYITGKFPEMGLSEIWHSRKFNKARLLHQKGDQLRIDLCRYCDSVAFHEYDETTCEHNGKQTLIRTELPTLKKDAASR